jgi:hypothetical protein
MEMLWLFSNFNDCLEYKLCVVGMFVVTFDFEYHIFVL